MTRFYFLVMPILTILIILVLVSCGGDSVDDSTVDDDTLDEINGEIPSNVVMLRIAIEVENESGEESRLINEKILSIINHVSSSANSADYWIDELDLLMLKDPNAPNTSDFPLYKPATEEEFTNRDYVLKLVFKSFMDAENALRTWDIQTSVEATLCLDGTPEPLWGIVEEGENEIQLSNSITRRLVDTIKPTCQGTLNNPLGIEPKVAIEVVSEVDENFKQNVFFLYATFLSQASGARSWIDGLDFALMPDPNWDIDYGFTNEEFLNSDYHLKLVFKSFSMVQTDSFVKVEASLFRDVSARPIWKIVEEGQVHDVESAITRKFVDTFKPVCE